MKASAFTNLHPIWVLVIFSTFFWGSNFNAGHALAADIAPLSAAAERFLLAMLFFLLLRLVQRQGNADLNTRDLLILLPLGTAGVFGFNFAFFTALQTTSALNAALIMALSPMVSLLLSAAMLGTPITGRQIIGMAIAFAGVSLVITGGNFAQLNVAEGDIWMLGACLLWSLFSVCSKKYAPHIPPLQLARWTVCIGAVLLIGAALWLEQPLADLPELPWTDHSILLYMALCGTLLAYIFWLKGVHAFGPDRLSICFNFVPMFTLLVSLVLGTLPSAGQLAGMLLALTGILYSTGWKPSLAFNRGPRAKPCNVTDR